MRWSPATCENAACRSPGPPSGGCSPTRTSARTRYGWLNRAGDPSFWARAGAVCRLYLDPPPGTVRVSIDEKTGIQAKTRAHPDIPACPGRDARREFEYARHGTVAIVAAMNVATGEVTGQRIARNDTVTFIGFPSMLDQCTALACGSI